jgi:hypothetical protein
VADTRLVVALSLAASLAFAASSSLKHISAGAAPGVPDLRAGTLARFLHATVTDRLWLAAIGCDLVALTLQVIALHLGALAVVQPLLIAGLVFSLLFRRLHNRRQVAGKQMAWAGVLCAALAAFLALGAGAKASGGSADRLPAVLAGASGAIVAVTCVALGQRMSGAARRAAVFGVAVGLIYAATAALLKALTDVAAAKPADLVSSWQLYTVVALGAAGLMLNQLAFQAGPLGASLPATATIDPLASIAIGVTVYDERIPRVDDAGVVLAILLLILGAAVLQLVRNSPV